MRSVNSKIAKTLGLMVVEADETSSERLNQLLKPKIFLADVPITDIVKEFRNITETGFKNVSNGLSNSDKTIKGMITNFDDLIGNNTKTLNNSVKNVSSDVSTMSRTVTQEVSAVSKGISGLSGIINGLGGAVNSIATGAVNAMLLENVVKPMFNTLTSTVDLGRITTQKFFEKQIAIFTPGSTSTSISANDSGFVQLIKNLANTTVNAVNNGITTITKSFTPHELSAIAAHYDPPFIKFLKYLTNATINSITNLQKSVSNLFQVVTLDNTLHNQDSAFVRLMKSLTNSTIKSVTNFENSFKNMFYVGSLFSENVTTDSNFVTLMKNLTHSTINAINDVSKSFTPFQISSIPTHYDPPFIKLLKYLTNTMVNTMSTFQKSVGDLFQVVTLDNALHNQDSSFIRLMKSLTNSTIKSVTNFENSLKNMFYVDSIFSDTVKNDSRFVNLLKNLFQSIKIPSFSMIETSLTDIIKAITKVPALNELIKNGFTDLSKTFTSILEPIKNIGTNVVKALFDSITRFFIPSDPNFLKNKIKGIQTKFNTKFQTPLSFLNLFKTLFNFKRTPFPKQVTLTFYGKETVIPLLILTMLFDVVRPITTALLCLTILAECYKRISGSDEATLQ